jgi:hypothetical protein
MAVHTKQQKIAQRAYELYESRGYADGYDLDDWLTAEAEVGAKGSRPSGAKRSTARPRASNGAKTKTNSKKK